MWKSMIILLSSGWACSISWAGGANPSAPFRTESEAVEAGEKLGIGSAVLEQGPRVVRAFSYQTFVIAYTAGKAGVQAHGAVRIGVQHTSNWTHPQTKQPSGDGYLSVKTSSGTPVAVRLDRELKKGGQPFFDHHFPWQHIVEFKLPQGLEPGEAVHVTYGDRSGGSPGIRMQSVDETQFLFKVFVDALGDDNYFPLRNSPAIRVVGAEPHRLVAVTPSNSVAGEATWCIVRVEDKYGNPADAYAGAVSLSSSDPSASLPSQYAFTEADGCVHRFEDIAFKTPGAHSIAVTASDKELQCESNPVIVSPQREELQLFWGELHAHTLFSDGKGTVEECYEFAQNVAGLDFCAVTDHAFMVQDWMWEHSKKVTNEAYKPGTFVTFNGYEWSGNGDDGGDHNVYFLADDPPIYRSRWNYNYKNLHYYHGPEPQVNHVEDLYAHLIKHLEHKNVFTGPHWGGRKGHHDWHHPLVQRFVEVFSDHRRSPDWAAKYLAKGQRLGILASGDNHHGNPGYGYLAFAQGHPRKAEIGRGLAAVYAKERTRESIFHALYDRHVYATSGDRIVLDFQADDHIMGSEYATAASPTLSIRAIGTALIVQIEINKNGKVVHTFTPNRTAVELTWQDPDFEPTQACYYYVRVVQSNSEEAISSPIWVN